MDQDLAINFLIHPSSTPLTRSFFPNTPLFPNTGRDWIELDLEVSESEVNLIGVAFLNDSIPDGLNLVKNIKPQKLFLTKMVPGNFSSYLGFPLDNIDQLETNFKGLSRRINLAIKKTNLSGIKNLREMAWIDSGGDASLIFSIIDVKENILIPGLVDMKAFVGEPGYEYKENFRTLSNAALSGGVTSVVTMPNTDPIIDNVSIVDFLKRRGRDKAKINIYPTATLTKNLEGKNMTEFGLLQSKGIIGFTGPQGAGQKGERGEKGVNGDRGFKGSNGATGLQGPRGSDGPRGQEGPDGPDGGKGEQGVKGQRGVKGIKGDVGVTGYTGSLGPTGAGAKGEKGDVGVTGYTGSLGPTGASVKGEKGDIGSTGQQGSTGEIGTKGQKGELGGPTGPAGTAGEKGPPGGPTGTKGEKGDFGGPTGYTGVNGNKGQRGETGPKGNEGVIGHTGPCLLYTSPSPRDS